MTATRFDPRYPRMFQRGYVPPPRDPRVALTSPIDIETAAPRRVRSQRQDPRVALLAPIAPAASAGAQSRRPW